MVEAGAGNAPNRGPYEKVENNIGIRRVSDMKSAEGKTKKMYFCVTAGCSYKSDRRNNVKRHRESQHEKPPKEVKVTGLLYVLRHNLENFNEWPLIHWQIFTCEGLFKYARACLLGNLG